MRHFDDNEKRITGIIRPRRIHTPPNVQDKWKKDAAEMRARIAQGKPAIEEKK